MSITKRLGASATAALAMTAGLVLFSPSSPASAASCSSSGSSAGTDGGSRSLKCTGNDFSSFRVQVRCEENSGSQYTAYGPWRSSGGTSTARCHEYAWLVTFGGQFQ